MAELNNNKTNIETLISTNNTLIEQEETLNDSLDTWNREYSKSLSRLNSAKEEIDNGYVELNKGMRSITLIIIFILKK